MWKHYNLLKTKDSLDKEKEWNCEERWLDIVDLKVTRDVKKKSHKKDKKNMIRRVGSTDERKIWKIIAVYKDYREC